jgi:hypothetical protein
VSTGYGAKYRLIYTITYKDTSVPVKTIMVYGGEEI